jgi:hypothetical protein
MSYLKTATSRIQSLLPLKPRSLVPNAYGGSLAVAAIFYPLLFYLLVTTAISLLADEKNLKRRVSYIAQTIRFYRQITTIFLLTVYIGEIIVHFLALEAHGVFRPGGFGKTILAQHTLPPPRLVWFWTVCSFFLITDLFFGFIATVRPVCRLIYYLIPQLKLHRTWTFYISEEVGELGATVDGSLARMSYMGAVGVLALCGI